jgi:hypothetical protein
MLRRRNKRRKLIRGEGLNILREGRGRRRGMRNKNNMLIITKKMIIERNNI